MGRAGEKITVSIVMPVYNDEAFVRRALRSCQTQTHKNIEIICVDDGSTDASPGILRAAACDDSRVKVIELEKNGGAHNARCAGVAEARGALITFLDADDELVRGACAQIADEFAAKPFDILHFGMHVRSDGTKTDEEVRDIAAWMTPPKGDLHGRAIVLGGFSDHTYAFNLCGKAYHADVVHKAFDLMGAHDTSYGEDALEYFAIAYLSTLYRSVPTKRLYVYHLGAGDSGNGEMSAADFARVLTGKQAVEGVRKLLETQDAFEENAELYETHRAAHVSFVLRVWYENVCDGDKAECLSALLDIWPHDEIVDVVSGFGSDALAVLRKCLGDVELTEEQLLKCGYADGYA
ncbi:MAG: glycosyltransferase family 2 protein, partial [Eggerthellaceae bacterium]|nr:glycosyltransferase family 2 protein [Eggerthellaceae bacterium]